MQKRITLYCYHGAFFRVLKRPTRRRAYAPAQYPSTDASPVCDRCGEHYGHGWESPRDAFCDCCVRIKDYHDAPLRDAAR